jgi:hypothetical protein
MRYIVKILRQQAKEISADGHYGWANTMTEAAHEIIRLTNDNVVLRKQLVEIIQSNKWDIETEEK